MPCVNIKKLIPWLSIKELISWINMKELMPCVNEVNFQKSLKFSGQKFENTYLAYLDLHS